MKSSKPKVLFEVNDEVLCFASYRSLFETCDKVLVVVGYRGADVREALMARASEVFGEEAVRAKTLFYTQEDQKGTGHAVKVALEGLAKGALAFSETIVANGDLPLLRPETLSPLVSVFKKASCDAACLSFKTDKPQGFGRILRDSKSQFVGIREEKDASDAERKIQEVNGGIYAFKTALLLETVTQLKDDNKQGEFYLTDLLKKTAQAYEVEDPQDLLGVNTTFELSEVRMIAQRRLKKNLCEEWGLDFINAESSFVSARAKFSGPVQIGPSCVILGKSEIGSDVKIEGHAFIKNSKIADKAEILWSSVITDSELGEGSKVGPMSHLRPQTILGKNVKVGNFVEIKKSILRDSSKASHLSYLGDADVGEEANIGAGTITCNFDGFNKFPTQIGKRAFIGSDSQLVAPIVIGDDAYVGSGTTVTEDVPNGALAISRSDMTIKEGYAQKLSAKRKALKKDT
jgi:bifunctional UDP-N-acetylglucosamine pyrophosphorylase / glucosamine-1-phosphate N-acetyltransferase